MNLSYRKSTTLTLFAFGSILLGLFYASLSLHDDANVYNVSQVHYQSKATERLEMLERFLGSFTPVLKAVENNHDFVRFIQKGDNFDDVADLLLTVKQSIRCIQQVRFINTKGQEIVRIEGPATRHNDASTDITHIVAKDALQDKSNSEYFKTFKQLLPGQIGMSEINLNTEHEIVEIPKKPTLRFGIAVYDQGQFKGVLVINVCLKDFFELFSHTTLYNIYVVNNQQRFLMHPDEQKSFLGEEINQAKLSDQFGEVTAQKIMHQQTYFGGHFYSTTISPSFSKTSYKLILEAKFKSMTEESNITAKILLGLMLLAILMTIPIALRLAKEPERLMLELDNKAHIDQLTRLPNRSTLVEHLKHNQHDIVIILAIEGFDDISNLYGYKLADQLLKNFAKSLTKHANSNNMQAYHLDRSHYGLTLKCSDMKAVEMTLAELHRTLESQPIEISEDLEIHISTSLGVARLEESNNINEAILDAEIALQQAQKLHYPYVILTSGKEELQKDYQHKIDMLKSIKWATVNKKVIVHFQPIIDTRTQTIFKHEALMRLRCEDDGICYPGEFLELAKTTSYYPEMTIQVIQQTVLKLKTLPKSQAISINFNMIDIAHPEVINCLIAETTLHQVADQLVIEIVESDDFGNFDVLLNFAKTIKKLGFKMAIDDFGSGYSNFQNIITLKPYLDYLKIDGSIVKNIAQDPTSLQLVTSIQDLANELKIETIAEFVHNELTYDLVKNMGINYAQGYYIGEPKLELLTEILSDVN